VSTAAEGSAGVLERDAELARIEAAVARAQSGRGSLLVVEGPAGIGKSALIGAARSVADAAGTRTLRARGGELERDFAFGVVRQLFEPALAEAPARMRADLLQGPAGAAGRLLGLPGALPEGAEAEVAAPDASFTVLHGLYWLCANLAADRPLVLTVDDAHWADAPSLRFLAFLLPRLEELPLALVVATRPEAEGAAAHLLGLLLADPLARVVRPAPLSAGAVGRLIEEGLGRVPIPAFAAACQRTTGGVPFLVRELVDALREEGVEPTAAEAQRVEALGARTVGRAMLVRLGRLPADAARFAQAVAVLETAELGQAADLAGLDVATAAEAADLLVAASILGPRRPLTFVHPIVRAGILEEVPPAERMRAHRRAAELLAVREDSAERVAEHLLATEPGGDAWTVARLTEAARDAARRGAPESAASYLRRVLVEPPPPAARPQILLELGVAEATAGQPEGEAHLREALEAARDDDVRLGAALVLAHVLGRGEQIGAAIEVIDLAAARLADGRGRARVLLESMATGAGMLDAATAPRVAARMRAMRRAADHARVPREVLAVAALVALHANEPAPTCIALAQRALAAGPRIVPEPTDLPWFAQATIALVWADALTEAQVPLDAGVAESRATGDPALFGMSLSQRAWLLLRLGDLQGAEGDARTVLEAADLAAPALYRKLAAAILVNASTERGELDQAQGVLDGFGLDEAARTQTSAVLRLARGRLRLAQDRPDEALADMRVAGEIVLATGSTCPGYLAWRSGAALAHAALGEREEGLRLAKEEVELARAFEGRRTLGIALRAAGVVAGGSEGETLLRESVDCLERSGVALERARALAELGVLVRATGRRAEARSMLREALDVAHHAGAAPLADLAEAELRATGAKPRRVALSGVEALTASERRVAELAGDGLTNREIAQALFVTMRTVEGHLTRVFAKLDLRSRDELPDVMRVPR
jgi:DNA-binding CsgD family transcriptional regulator